MTVAWELASRSPSPPRTSRVAGTILGGVPGTRSGLGTVRRAWVLLQGLPSKEAGDTSGWKKMTQWNVAHPPVALHAWLCVGPLNLSG